MTSCNISSYEYLVKENKGLVYHIVNRFHVSPFDRDDLIQAGMMGLLEAIKKYDIEKGAFSSFAVKYILENVKKEYAKQNAVITNSYYMNLIKKVQNDNNLGYEELAKKYKTTVENVIVAVNFQNRISYLDDDEIDLIKDEKNDKLDIDELDEIETQIYRMRVLYQMSQKEIALKLGINQSTVCRKLKNIASKVF